MDAVYELFLSMEASEKTYDLYTASTSSTGGLVVVGILDGVAPVDQFGHESKAWREQVCRASRCSG